MRTPTLVQFAILSTSLLPAQPALGPVINPRGVVNAVTMQPAPSSVSPGAIILIQGLNLGPAAGATANAAPLSTQLGEVEVLINNRLAPLFSVSASRIVAQVPWETPNGQAQVVVRRNGSTSRAARINILNPLPSVYTKDNKGYGELAGTLFGRKLAFSASGLGVTEPRLNNGETASPDFTARPRAPIAIHVGGLRVEADIKASEKRVGEFDITIDLPESAKPGDIVTVETANRLANFATWRLSRSPEVTYLPFPPGTPEIRGMQSSDLRGGFLLASAARTDNGCWPSFLIDLPAQKISPVSECLSAANRNALAPAVPAINGPALAAFIGPAQEGTPGVSSKIAIFHPANPQPMSVDLPSTATALLSPGSGNYAAVLGGTPPQVASIDSVTGEVQIVQGGGAGGGGALPGGGGAGPGGAIIVANLSIDLGDGINKILTPAINMGQGQLLVVVGDDTDNPNKAKVAVINNQGAVTASRDFADGWLPIVNPRAPQGQGGGAAGGGGGGLPGGPGGGPGGPGGFQNRVSFFNDAQTRTLYVMSRKADNSGHGMTAFLPNEVRTIPTPDGRFIAACTSNPQILNIETSRRIAVLSSNSPSRDFQRLCAALGFLVLDLATGQFTAVDLPGQGQINATGNVSDLNDFLLAPDTTGETLFALDGVTNSAFRFDLPQGVTAVSNLIVVPAMELAIAVARNRQPNDAGFVVFDVERVETRHLPLPDGFANAQLAGILPATRKVVARGTRTGNTGTQFFVYDLFTGELSLPDNPPGVAFVGAVPAQQPQPGQGGQPQQAVPPIQRVNAKANTIEAITFGADRRQNGAILIRVH